MAMTKAERYLLDVLAEVLCRHLGPDDDLYWSVKVGIDELESESQFSQDFQAFMGGINPNE